MAAFFSCKSVFFSWKLDYAALPAALLLGFTWSQPWMSQWGSQRGISTAAAVGQLEKIFPSECDLNAIKKFFPPRDNNEPMNLIKDYCDFPLADVN